MPVPPSHPTPAELEEAGFEALQRLYIEAVDDVVEAGRTCARLLLGLYNCSRFPFDLPDLRTLPESLLEDAMVVLRMDARLRRREVHSYFDDGSFKFEALADAYRVHDIERLKATGDGSPRPRAERGTLCHEDRVSAQLVSCSEAPGYRDVTLRFDCEVVGHERQAVGPVRLEVCLGPADGVRVMEHVQQVQAFVWQHGNRPPLDATPGEQRPAWLERAPSSLW